MKKLRTKKLRYFLDTEFIEDGLTVELLSLALVCEDGRELYLCSKECDIARASDWVMKNVVPHLPPRSNTLPWCSRAFMRSAVKNFVLECDEAVGTEPEFWGYYADYDWVVLCQLWGLMIDLPGAFPKFCMDLKQLCVSRGIEHLPKAKVEHEALADARWIREHVMRLLGQGK